MKKTLQRMYPVKAVVLFWFLSFSQAWGLGEFVTDDFKTAVDQAHLLAEKYGGPQNVFIAFDLDNTLLTANQDLGSDQWFVWQSELQKKDSKNKDLVAPDFKGLLKVSGLLLTLGSMHPVQSNGPTLVRQIQEGGFPTIVLTSRGVELHDTTLRELNRNGYDFSQHGIEPSSGVVAPYFPYEKGKLESEGFTKEETERFGLTAEPSLVWYQNGVYLTSGQHKGAMVRLLWNKLKKSYKAALLIDDTERNTVKFYDALKEKVDVNTYRYSRLDPQVKAFHSGSKAKVTAEWKALQQTLDRIFKK